MLITNKKYIIILLTYNYNSNYNNFLYPYLNNIIKRYEKILISTITKKLKIIIYIIKYNNINNIKKL